MPTFEERKALFDKYAYEIGHQTGSRRMTLGNQISSKVKKRRGRFLYSSKGTIDGISLNYADGREKLA